MDADRSARVLVVYDGSSIGDRALHAAIDRARALGADVTVLAVMPPRLWRARQGQFQIRPDKHDEEWAREQLARARQMVREAGLKAETLIRTGPPAHVIAEEAARGYAALLLPTRASMTGAPPLARYVAVPKGCEIVAVS
jgi:nucleotide-binding universal stress UspA family protein